MAFGSSDIPAMLELLGVDVVLGDLTVKGLKDQSVPELGLAAPGAGGVSESETVVTIFTGSLPAIAVGSSLTVDGVAFVVRSVRPMEDGELTQVLVRRGTP